jgi:hypothetical protein
MICKVPQDIPDIVTLNENMMLRELMMEYAKRLIA